MATRRADKQKAATHSGEHARAMASTFMHLPICRVIPRRTFNVNVAGAVADAERGEGRKAGRWGDVTAQIPSSEWRRATGTYGVQWR